MKKRRSISNLFSAFIITCIALVFSGIDYSFLYIIVFSVVYVGLCVGDILDIKEHEMKEREAE